MTHNSSLTLKDIEVKYGDTTAVDRIDLDIKAGEFIALLGPSGCGKTSLLRVIAGFTRATRGQVLLNQQDISPLPPEARRIGMVFQNYALFPHMTIEENIAYGLKAHGATKQQIKDKVNDMLSVVRMEKMRDRLPRQLSGGQQQRVALARALAISPSLLLLDEPLGALDKNLREEMQRELMRIQHELNITTIMVTHDQDEAMAMADRIAILNQGQIMQFGTCDEIYDKPNSLFVSKFIGKTTQVEGDLKLIENNNWSLKTKQGNEFFFQSNGPCKRPGKAIITLRPEHIEIHPDGIEACVTYIRSMGHALNIIATLSDGTEVEMTEARNQMNQSFSVGQKIHLRIKPEITCPVFVL